MEFSNVRAIAYRPYTYVRVRVNLLQCVTYVRFLEITQIILTRTTWCFESYDWLIQRFNPKMLI